MIYEEKFIGSTEIDISGTRAKVNLWRNENGNIVRHIEDEEKICPQGTCLEGYSDEIIISRFEP